MEGRWGVKIEGVGSGCRGLGLREGGDREKKKERAGDQPDNTSMAALSRVRQKCFSREAASRVWDKICPSGIPS